MKPFVQSFPLMIIGWIIGAIVLVVALALMAMNALGAILRWPRLMAGWITGTRDGDQS